MRVVALVGGAHGGARNDVRNDDALGSASRVPVWRVVAHGRTNRPKWLTSPRTTSTRIEVPMDVDANIIDGATHQSGAAQST